MGGSKIKKMSRDALERAFGAAKCTAADRNTFFFGGKFTDEYRTTEYHCTNNEAMLDYHSKDARDTLRKFHDLSAGWIVIRTERTQKDQEEYARMYGGGNDNFGKNQGEPKKPKQNVSVLPVCPVGTLIGDNIAMHAQMGAKVEGTIGMEGIEKKEQEEGLLAEWNRKNRDPAMKGMRTAFGRDIKLCEATMTVRGKEFKSICNLNINSWSQTKLVMTMETPPALEPCHLRVNIKQLDNIRVDEMKDKSKLLEGCVFNGKGYNAELAHFNNMLLDEDWERFCDNVYDRSIAAVTAEAPGEPAGKRQRSTERAEDGKRPESRRSSSGPGLVDADGGEIVSDFDEENDENAFPASQEP